MKLDVTEVLGGKRRYHRYIHKGSKNAHEVLLMLGQNTANAVTKVQGSFVFNTSMKNSNIMLTSTDSGDRLQRIGGDTRKGLLKDEQKKGPVEMPVLGRPHPQLQPFHWA